METELVKSARDYAFSMHKGGYGKHPYSHHLNMVVDELLEVIECIDEEKQPILIAAAYLHDVVEDCPETNISIIEDRFGKKVSEIVWALTNDTGKRASVEYYEKIAENPLAQIIKLCDRIANVKHCLNLNGDADEKTSFDKMNMYLKENDSFIQKIGYTTSTDSEVYIKIIQKLKLKLVHLFNLPRLSTQQDCEVNKNVRKLSILVSLDQNKFAANFEMANDEFTSLEIMGILELITTNYRQKNFGIQSTNNIFNSNFESNAEQITSITKKINEIENKINNQSDVSPLTEFINLNTAAKFLHLSSSRLYTICQQRKITYIKRGKKLLFTREGLIAYLNEGKKSSKKQIISDSINTLS